MSKSLSRALSFLKSKSFRAKKGKAEISEEVLAPDETALAQIGEDSPRTKDRKFDEEKNSEELSEQETQVGEDSDEAEKHVDDREVENQGGKQSKGGKASRGGSLFSRRQFFFDREKEKQAPMRFPELAKKFHKGDLTEDTVVWYKDLGQQFMAIKDIPELLVELREDAERRNKQGEEDGYDDDFDSAEESTEEEDKASKAEKLMPDAWRKVAASMPLAKTPEDREKRALLFLRWDPNGNGYLSLAEIDKGVQETAGLQDLFKCKPAIIRAYKAAKGLKKGREGSKEDDYVSKIEFRMLLVYLKLYFGLFCIFEEMDTGHDRRVDKDEFRAAAPSLRELGCPIAEDPDETFARVDKDSGGQVLFNEFCQWAIAHNILAENTAGPAVPVAAAAQNSVILPKIEEVSEEERYSSDEEEEEAEEVGEEEHEASEPHLSLAASVGHELSTPRDQHVMPAAQDAGPQSEEAMTLREEEAAAAAAAARQQECTQEAMSESWAEVSARLPVQQTVADKTKRAQLFSLWDPNCNGFLSLAEIDRGVSITAGLEQLHKCKPALLRAFSAAKALKPGDASKAGLQDDDYVSRIEFRMLLVFLKLYFGLFQIFDQIDTGHDRRVDIEEFEAAAPSLRELGCPIAEDPDHTFREIDRDGGGQILFNEFCEWAVNNNLLLNPESEGKTASSSSASVAGSGPGAGPASVPQFALPPGSTEEDRQMQGLMTDVWGQVRGLSSELDEMKARLLAAMAKRAGSKSKSHRGPGLAPSAPRTGSNSVCVARAASLPSASANLSPSRQPVLEDPDGAASPRQRQQQSQSVTSSPHSSAPSTAAGSPKKEYTPRDNGSFKRLTTNFQRLQPETRAAQEFKTPLLPRTQSDGARRLAERLWGDVKPRLHLQRSSSYGMLDRNAISSAGSDSSAASAYSTRSEKTRHPTDKYVWGKGAAQRAALRAEEIKRLERAEAFDTGRGVRVDARDRLAAAQACLEFRGERHVERQAFRAQPISVGNPIQWS